MSEGGFEKGRVSEEGVRRVSEERRVSEKSGAAIPHPPTRGAEASSLMLLANRLTSSQN